MAGLNVDILEGRSMIEILHVCPGNCTTGGPECIHAFVSELNKIEDVHARIWYWDIQSSDPCPEEYKSYGCEYVTELPEGFDGTIIVPEIWANKVMDYPQCTRAIYWLGVDAYAGWTPGSERGAFLRDEDIIHICQSEYAYDFLKKLKVKRLIKCVDIINTDFYQEYEETEREDVILYNPAKATPFMYKIIEQSGLSFKPITGMTRQQVIDTMRRSKLYVDFGEFPGRERMPREAVLCGCCIITSKIGSADYDIDFTHEYKFDSKDGHIWAIIHKIQYVLDHYEECRKDFDLFRHFLKGDIQLMERQCKGVINEIQHHHSGA